MTYGQFHEALLPPDVSSGFTRRDADGVEIVRLDSGAEERNRRWSRVRRSWTAGYRLRNIERLTRLADFWEARGGRAFGFRMRDWLDWNTNMGRKGCAAPTPCDDLLVDLRKHDGALQIPIYRTKHNFGRQSRRRIFKPRCGCGWFRIAVDGAEMREGWTVDPARGIVTFESLPSGDCVTWGGIYDAPVRFDMDALQIDLAAPSIGEAVNLALVELIHERDVYPEEEQDEFSARFGGDEESLARDLAQSLRALKEITESLPPWP
ncbi:DUF2460 domain-containing protein [Neomegalonema sp.]|uniref:DUF2460 domain-containing protein n=1 Tax=Neomegalonema sp. TaxID=2039713 RepID=UPI00262EB76F|nr:DUF2460 domain-containing protein [Neomegalonema sp.]MDD2870300.1 DUF2460 domain-containing protein [Neomegalonema sp.]